MNLAFNRAKAARSWRSHAAGIFAGCAIVFLAVHASPVPAAQKEEKGELSTETSDATFTLRSERNLVLVRVIVRDSQGRIVGNLRKEDFRLFDNRKPQIISSFSVERPSQTTAEAAGKNLNSGEPTSTSSPAPFPSRFLALYFDDVHLKFEDLSYTRAAAKRYLATALQPGSRVGIFTASGLGDLDFTNDRDKLDAALDRLRPHPLAGGEANPCPDLSPYEAYLIEERHDPTALQIATEEVIECLCNGDPSRCPNPEEHARAKAMEVMRQDEYETRDTLRVTESLVRILASKPGERNMVLVSPGFLDRTVLFELSDIIDRALRANVTISALDARGLYAFLPLGDASKNGVIPMNQPALMGSLTQIRNTGDSIESDPLSSLADSTGGVFFHNSNDYDAAFRKTGALPDVYYVLAFTPQDLKYDGKFHAIKVELANGVPFSIQARKGYFAPRKAVDASMLAQDEIRDAVYSQQETNTIPVGIHTQFFKAANSEATLFVFTHVDVRTLRFRKEAGRNLDNLTVVTVLFDDSGSLVTGQQKVLELDLRDTTLERLKQSGMTIKTGLDVKPGNYMVRSVVRDSGSGEISSVNQPTEIP